MEDRPPEEQIVYVKPANAVRYGTVVTLVNAIGDVGIDRVGLVSEKNKTDKQGSTVPATRQLSKAPGLGEPHQGIIVIEVKSRTRWKLNSRPVSFVALRSRLKAMLHAPGDKTVFITAPGKISYGEVVSIIDLAKSAGAHAIGLRIDQSN